MKVLIVQLRQLGDILLTTPCIKAIKLQYPDAQVDFLSHAMGKLVLKNNPFLDCHWTYTEKDSLRQHAQLIKNIRRESYTHAIDFMNNPRSALLTLLSGAKERWGVSSARSWCYNQRTKRSSTQGYIVKEKFELLEAAGFKSNDTYTDLPWDESDKKPLQSIPFNNQQLRIALSPTHRRPARKWQAHKWIALANSLLKKNHQVVWIWGPGERDEVEEMQQQTSTKSFLAPKTSFSELAALLAHTDLFIGTSNGPSHVATASGTCTLQLHGHTRATSWSPSTPRHRWIQSPEYSHPSPTLNSIEVDEVLVHVESMKEHLESHQKFRMENKLVWDLRLGL